MITKSTIAKHPRYAEILAVYTQEFAANGGKVNDKKFWETHIHPIAPDFKMISWYRFIRTFRRKSGMVASHAIETIAAGPAAKEEKKLESTMMTNDAATQLGIRAALNIGAKALESLLADPEALMNMSVKERTELLFKAMKSQDSRIHAVGKLKEDGREQAKFDRAFGDLAM